MSVIISGDNGITFPDSSSQAESGLGFNQTWQNMTGSRVSGTTYTISTGKPIQGTVSQRGGSSVWTYAYVNGVQVSQVTTTTSTTAIFPTTFIVPNGNTYSVTGTIDYWAELR